MNKAQSERETAYLLDVDGVITHPETREAPGELLDELVETLHRGDLVIFNTGRSIEWLTEPVLKPFLEKVDETRDLSRFLVVGEMGGTWIPGTRLNAKTGTVGKPEIDQELSVPKDIQTESQKLAEESYADSMFYDRTKLTMVSIEMGKDVSVDDFMPEQKKLAKELRAIVKAGSSQQSLQVHVDRIATNIMENHMGKSLGVDRALEWMKKSGFRPEGYRYLTFGDSRSDAEMAERLSGHGYDVTFVYVGEPSELEAISSSAKGFDVVGTDAHCEQGTIEYLNR